MIRKLPQQLIIKIAAGQVIERPYNALKQLIQNSIDAQSTAIHITIHQSGLSRLQIADNGKGIHPDDYPLLCQRFATSKLSTYQDLTKIMSFGFRGEALASLSFVGNVEVVSRVQGNVVGYKGEFKDGKLVAELIAVSRNQGTSIKVRNLFGGMETRRKAVGVGEEKRRITKLVGWFAMHYPGVRFELVSEKGIESKFTHLQTEHETQLFIFSQIFSLPPFFFFSSSTTLSSISLSGIFSKLSPSSPNSHPTTKSKTLILFINNRLVQSSQLFKSIQRAYSYCYTSIHEHLETFSVYLRVEMDPKYVDCNVHPTKKEVRVVGSGELGEGVYGWVVKELKENCGVKRMGIGSGKGESVGGSSVWRGGEGKKEGFDKIRTEPTQLPLKFYINEKSKKKEVEEIMQSHRKQMIESFKGNVLKEQSPEEDQNMEGVNIPKDTVKQQREQLNQNNTIIKTKPKHTDKNPLASFLNFQPKQIPELPLSPTTLRLPKPSLTQQLKLQSVQLALTQSTCTLLHLSLTLPSPTTPLALSTKRFVQQFSYIGCYNLNYIFVQYKHSLLFLNILPFLYPTLINYIKRFGLVHLEQVKQKVNVYDTLIFFAKKTGLGFDVEEYSKVVVKERQIIKEKIGVQISENGLIERVCYPAFCLQGKYSMLQISYLLARIAKTLLLSPPSIIDYTLWQKYLIEYFVKLFKTNREIEGQQHRKVNEFMETEIIPIMKTRTVFEEIEIGKYSTGVVELKNLYQVFQRC